MRLPWVGLSKAVESCSIAVRSDGAVAPLMPLLLWPSPHERLPLFPRYCRSNCSLFVWKIPPWTYKSRRLWWLLLYARWRRCLINTAVFLAIAVCRVVDAVALPMLRLLKPVLRVGGCCCLANAAVVLRTQHFCFFYFNCGYWCCCLTAVASPMRRLLWPLRCAGWCGCLANAAVVVTLSR